MKKLTSKKCYGGKDHRMDLIAESTQASHYWCPVCGSYSRYPDDSDKVEFSAPQIQIKGL